jgi:hypothetical protein
MRRLLFLSFILLLPFITKAQETVFDPATYDVQNLPVGMTIVEIESVKYLKVALKGLDSKLDIDPFFVDGYVQRFEFRMKYKEGTSGFLASEVFTATNLNNDEQSAVGQGIFVLTNDFSDYEMNVVNANDTITELIVAAFDASYNLVIDDTVFIGKIDAIIAQVRPIANAGSDQNIASGSLVTLDGTASYDPNGNDLTYLWSAPPGISLSSYTSAQPTFTAPSVSQNTDYTFTLVVDDGTQESFPDEVTITVTKTNTKPQSDAGTGQIVTEGVEVTLDGTGSSDPDEDEITFLWTAPEGITLSSNTVSQPTFTAPDVEQETDFFFSLTVNDGELDSDPDIVKITVQNSATVPPTLAIENETVGLGQTRCYDATQTITVAGNSTTVTFQTGSTVEIIAGQSIRFLPGFWAQNNSYVHAHISTVFCTPAGAPAQQAISEKGAVIDDEFPNKKLTETDKSVKIYPNPTNGKITVELTNYDKMAQIDIYNTLGSKVYSTSTIRSIDLNLGHVEKGLYVVRITSDESVQTRKVIVQ